MKRICAMLLASAGLPVGAGAADLSMYREFRLGSDLATVSKLAGMSASQAKVLHRRPALVQNLEWRPQPLGASKEAEAAQEVIFSFYDGGLYRIEVNYDRNEVEGLTAEDMVAAISANYGQATKPPAPVSAELSRYSDLEEVLGRWEDAQHRFELRRSSYGSNYKLVGVLLRLEAQAQIAILEAERLDAKEAPLKDAERKIKEDDTERAKLEKARLLNKPKFRP